MTKVLVPYDFSEQAQYALDFTTNLAAKLDNITVEVLHVLEIPTNSSLGTMGGGEMMPEIENQIFFVELTERRKKQMKELEEKFKSQKFEFKTKLKLGNAFQAISESINEEKPDLVVMGSKGSSGLEEVLVGSNTEKVVRNAKCPVVTIKSPVDPKDLKKIVFASDFRENSDEVAARIKRLQKLFGAELYLVNVNTPGSFETTRESIARIKHYVKKYSFENVKAEIYNSSSEESGIIEFAEDIDADLIAMATHGRTGFLHLITGSIAEDVVNHAKRPVWTFRAE
ncbi:universal stress protein [Algoriphagus algorifonticola]|jgi:nucleotide-binding universal stress UspA family protein|uniref:universal stress protein n=1 Tax=Algoriphagus algorifonticola TaxID=2593007 RepID=UPI0011A160B3|nr:universal stress protein [Algoriphagus algorifonticola]